jgi:DNA-binding MarR family transcriptional regulator
MNRSTQAPSDEIEENYSDNAVDDGSPATTPAPADNALTLVHLLSNRITRAFYSEIETRFGVSLPEWRVMMTLARYPDLTAVDITTRWSMDKMTISRAIRRLEENGRIHRTRHPQDRRSYTVLLTDEGMAFYERVVPVANARYRAITACLDHSEAQQLRATLEKLINQAAGLP